MARPETIARGCTGSQSRGSAARTPGGLPASAPTLCAASSASTRWVPRNGWAPPIAATAVPSASSATRAVTSLRTPGNEIIPVVTSSSEVPLGSMEEDITMVRPVVRPSIAIVAASA